MNTDFFERKQIIYELMNGAWDLQFCPVPESAIVEDEFAEGKPCEVLYQQAYEAAMRICKRLQVEEDPDIELIIDNLLKIAEKLSLKMYDYGAYFGPEK